MKMTRKLRYAKHSFVVVRTKVLTTVGIAVKLFPTSLRYFSFSGNSKMPSENFVNPVFFSKST